jgi:hypothetical protein
VLDAYGHRCAECGITSDIFLTVDHVDGGGRAHRRAGAKNGYELNRRVIAEGCPLAYQLLCWNCNWSKYIDTLPTVSSPKVAWSHRLRAAAFDAYGNTCSCCGVADPRVLSIHHVHGNGADDRRRTGARNSDVLYGRLKREGYPADYSLLCRNCNWATSHGGCPHADLLLSLGPD